VTSDGQKVNRINLCRGKDLLYERAQVFTCHAFLTPPSSFRVNEVAHSVLFPYVPPGRAPPSDFHWVSFHSLLTGPSFTAPVSRPFTLPSSGLPIFLLSYRPLVAGEHELQIHTRWVFDQFGFLGLLDEQAGTGYLGAGTDPRTTFLGEAELHEGCGPTNQHSMWCFRMASETCAPTTDVLAGQNRNVTVLEKEGGGVPDFLDLPLATTASRPSDGFWYRAGRDYDDCMSRKEENEKYFTGEVCWTQYSDSPIYVWLPTDRRYHLCVREVPSMRAARPSLTPLPAHLPPPYPGTLRKRSRTASTSAGSRSSSSGAIPSYVPP
jgi:hypothetical protein